MKRAKNGWTLRLGTYSIVRSPGLIRLQVDVEIETVPNAIYTNTASGAVEAYGFSVNIPQNATWSTWSSTNATVMPVKRTVAKNRIAFDWR